MRDFVGGLVGNDALAEDLTQETFVRAQRSESSRRGESSLKTWLIAIALNLVRDYFRAAGRAPAMASGDGVLEGLDSGGNIERELLEKEMSECIAGHLARLPSPYFDVVALHDRAGLEAIMERSPILGDVRGLGMLLAVEMVADKVSKRPLPNEFLPTERIRILGLENGVMLYSRPTAGSRLGHWFMVAPPLTITEEECRELLRRTEAAVTAFHGELNAAGAV